MLKLLTLIIFVIVVLAAFEVDLRGLGQLSVVSNNLDNLKEFLLAIWHYVQNMAQWLAQKLT